jgi:hypothetical protein
LAAFCDRPLLAFDLDSSSPHRAGELASDVSREQTGRIVSLKRSRKPRRLQIAMPFPDFAAFSIWTNVGVFVGAAALIWVAGARPANYADAINVRTQLNHAFLGMVLLGFATSLLIRLNWGQQHDHWPNSEETRHT